MDSIITIIKIVTKDFHGKIDLKDAYYSALLSKKTSEVSDIFMGE